MLVSFRHINTHGKMHFALDDHAGCVRATSFDALENGFAPFVVRKACADRHRYPHGANLFDIQAKYGEGSHSSGQ